MARLTAAKRKKLPKRDFGLPAKAKKGPRGGAKKGSYPMPDKAHARNAKARASEMEHKGKLSKSAEEKIDAKANRKLDEKGDGPKEKKRSRKRLDDVTF